MTHIDRISPFQVYRIYQETLLQYFPNAWVSAPCCGISRCRNSAPNSPNGANSPSFYSSPSYHHFRPHSDIPSPSAQVPTCFGANPDLGRAFSKWWGELVFRIFVNYLQSSQYHTQNLLLALCLWSGASSSCFWLSIKSKIIHLADECILGWEFLPCTTGWFYGSEAKCKRSNAKCEFFRNNKVWSMGP
jgi:hypothetical protein